MLLPLFEYKRAHSVVEALFCFQKSAGEAAYLAGGTDLIPRLKLGLKKPRTVVDLKGIEEMYGVREDEEGVKIGALTTLKVLESDRIVEKYFPLLKSAIEVTACETIKMRATIGGNILQGHRCLFYNQSEFWRKAKGLCVKTGGVRCHVTGSANCFANYKSDLAPALIACEAKVTVEGLNGKKTVSLEELYTGDPLRPFALSPEEIVTEIILPRKLFNGHYWKLRVRGSIDYPEASVCVSKGDGNVKIVVGALGPVPKSKIFSLRSEIRPEELESFFKEIKLIPNSFLDAEYRREICKLVAKKIISTLIQGERK